jgi:hypothetical protein
MNVNSGGPHILLFERDQQLMALLSGELAQAGYEVHTSRTAVEVFDAIARFPIRLVMVNLAQAQAGRREFWVALDAQRRGRGVQVFTFRCSNLAGYGPDDPEEHIQTIQPDQEVDGMLGVAKLVSAIRTRVPGSAASPSSPTRQASAPMQALNSAEVTQVTRSVDVSAVQPAQPVAPQPAPMQQSHVATVQSSDQPGHTNLRSHQSLEKSTMVPPTRSAEPSRGGSSAFTDKIRAVIYPSSRSFSPIPETSWSPPVSVPPPQNASQHLNAATQNVGQHPHAGGSVQNAGQQRQQASQRVADGDSSSLVNREEMMYQAPLNTETAGQQTYNTMVSHNSSSDIRTQPAREESGLDQLSRLLRESQPSGVSSGGNGNSQRATPGLSVDPKALQDLHTQLLQAARQDEAYGRSNTTQQQPGEVSGVNGQLRASPIQDTPFEREIEHRRSISAGIPFPENFARPAMTILQPTQAIPQQQAGPSPFSPGQTPTVETRTFSSNSKASVQPLSPLRESSLERSAAGRVSSQIKPTEEIIAQVESEIQEESESGLLGMEDDETLEERVQATFQETLNRRPEVKTTDDTLLDIVKSLPPMAPAPQPPQVQVLNGRATRSLGSVLLEGHLVPQERLQVAQHVQRMLRGVDINYQLGEILLMFKLLTPDQLLAASLVSYGMISTTQITALGRIRQELHAIGLEYDLESLLVLFRILTPEQLREVRASWSS